MMDAKQAFDLSSDLEKASHGRLSAGQKKAIMRKALKLKLECLEALKERSVERCDPQNDRSRFYRVATYSRVCGVLDSLV